MTGVSVIIPTWNQAALVHHVLEDLKNQSVAPLEVVVVDNGSNDDTVARAAAAGARVLKLSENIGFAGAVNAGIKASAGEWLLILNNDVELDSNWIEETLRSAAEHQAHLVTGKLLQARSPDKLDGAWDLVSRAGCAWRCGWNSPDGTLWNQSRVVPMVSLTAALIQRRVFERVGLLDTRYESYYEDVDFSIRCGLADFVSVYEPAAVARHIGSATLGGSPRVTYLISRNQVLLAAKFGLAKSSRWTVVAGQILAMLPAVRRGHLIASLKGKLAGLRLVGALIPENVDQQRVRAWFISTEQELREYQSKLGPDFSWKLYFAIAPA